MQWKGRRVLLTGHTGFKGAWLSLWLHQLGATVTGISLAPHTTPSLFEQAQAAHGITSHIADIRDAEAVRSILLQAQPELVIHMAAQALVGASYADPVATYAVNVMGVAHVLDAVRHTPSVRAVIIVTSDKCYENREWPWPYRETDTLGGYDPYSNSKACAELVASAFRTAFFHPDRFGEHGVAIATARAGNVIGGGDWAVDRLVPDAVRAFTANHTLHLRNPSAIRPWQHVLEPLRGYLILGDSLLTHGTRSSGAWNFGSGPDAVQPVSAVVKELASHWPSAQWSVTDGNHPHEAGILTLDCAKAKAELGWAAAFSFRQGIAMTADWYARFYAGEDAATLCARQIAEYQLLTGPASI